MTYTLDLLQIHGTVEIPYIIIRHHPRHLPIVPSQLLVWTVTFIPSLLHNTVHEKGSNMS